VTGVADEKLVLGSGMYWASSIYQVITWSLGYGTYILRYKPTEARG
jgi:hypothetical protein